MQTQTPLTDLLDRVPIDTRVIHQAGRYESHSIPVGSLCAEAAARIREMEAQVKTVMLAEGDVIHAANERIQELEAELKESREWGLSAQFAHSGLMEAENIALKAEMDELEIQNEQLFGLAAVTAFEGDPNELVGNIRAAAMVHIKQRKADHDLIAELKARVEQHEKALTSANGVITTMANEIESLHKRLQRSAGVWAPVGERNPDHGGMIPVLLDSKETDEDCYRGGFWYYCGNHVTHWLDVKLPGGK